MKPVRSIGEANAGTARRRDRFRQLTSLAMLEAFRALITDAQGRLQPRQSPTAAPTPPQPANAPTRPPGGQ